MTAPNPPSEEEHPSHGASFWVSAAVGAAIVAYGLAGILRDSAVTRPSQLARFALGAGIAHDFVLAPFVVAAGWLSRKLPAGPRLLVRIGFGLSLVLLLVTWPVVRGYAKNTRNPSIVPLDYGHNLRVALLVIWASVGVAALLQAVRSRRSSRSIDTGALDEGVRR